MLKGFDIGGFVRGGVSRFSWVTLVVYVSCLGGEAQAVGSLQ